MMSFTEYFETYAANLSNEVALARYENYKADFAAMNEALAALRDQLLAESK